MFANIKISKFVIPIMEMKGYDRAMTSDDTRIMDATAFRQDLTKVINRLPDEGPLRIMLYGKVVAEIRPAGPENEAAYTQRWLDLAQRLAANGLRNALDMGLTTYAALSDLADRYESYQESGVSLNYADMHLNAEKGADPILDPEELIARVYFDGDYPKMDSVAWFHACIAIQQYARDRGMSDAFPQYDWDSTAIRLINDAKENGHTPQTFEAFCRQALTQGVPLNQVDRLLGKDVVPADVLAMKSYSEYVFEGLTTEDGLPHAEAVEVFRKGINTVEAGNFVEAGVRTASEIQMLIDLGVSSRLAKRAKRDGMMPEEWRRILPKTQKFQYEETGLLPFHLLAEAAEKGVSLVRWDKNSHIVSADYYHDKTTDRPWNWVYPDSVLRLAEAKIAPTYVKEFSELFCQYYKANAGEGFTDDVISLRQAGLSSELLKAIRKLRGPVENPLTPKDVRRLLGEGLTVNQAKHLSGITTNKKSWLVSMLSWREYQPQVLQFIEARKNTQGWQDVLTVATHFKATRKVKYGFDFWPMSEEAIERLDTPERLTKLHLAYLFSNTCWLLELRGDHTYRNASGSKLPADLTDQRVRDLWIQFDLMLKNLASPAVPDEEHQVEQIKEGCELTEGQRQIEA